MRRPMVGVVGSGKTLSADVEALAMAVGRAVAREGAVLVCGGLGGVMRAAARGAKEAGGVTMGILPGSSADAANTYIDFPVVTNMGQARNAIIVQTADVVIAVGGGYGTLSEMALALKIGKSVIALAPRFTIPGIQIISDPAEAVRVALSLRPKPAS